MSRSTARLESFWDAHTAAVRRYASRQVETDAVDDILSETFLVAWRRIDDVPTPALPWLLVTARNLAANHRRLVGRRREDGAGMERVAELVDSAGGPEATALDRAEARAGLAALTDAER